MILRHYGASQVVKAVQRLSDDPFSIPLTLEKLPPTPAETKKAKGSENVKLKEPAKEMEVSCEFTYVSNVVGD